MKNFEKKLQNLKVPYIEDKVFENRLKESLLNNFFSKESLFKLRYKIATIFAIVFLGLLLLLLIKPNIASNINRFAFGKRKDDNLEKILFTFPDDKANYNSIVYKSKDNPYKQLPEEKRYIIHKYRTSKNKRIMVISEVPIKKRKKMKIIY